MYRRFDSSSSKILVCSRKYLFFYIMESSLTTEGPESRKICRTDMRDRAASAWVTVSSQGHWLKRGIVVGLYSLTAAAHSPNASLLIGVLPPVTHHYDKQCLLIACWLACRLRRRGGLHQDLSNDLVCQTSGLWGMQTWQALSSCLFVVCRNVMTYLLRKPHLSSMEELGISSGKRDRSWKRTL